MAERIAIVGMACRFPGADSLQRYWENLTTGVESIRRFTQQELLRAGEDPGLVRDPLYVPAAPVLEDVFGFDADFFAVAPREAELMDPQQRKLLEVAWEAMEDAGMAGLAQANVGVFAGSGGVVSSYFAAHLPNHPEFLGATGGLEHIGNDKDFLSTRLSFKLDLTGPSVNVQTACSTSMVAVHLARQSLLQMECDAAIVGASVVRVPHLRGYLARKGDILSPDGHCRAFDASAEGTIFGSGVAAVVLKRLSDAIADGDDIYAVLNATAINNDGARKVSYTASSVTSQAKAMVRCMADGGADRSTVGFVECHATGTTVGDPLEVMALARAMKAIGGGPGSECLIGSVKTNIGHLEQAAGLAALMKAALAVKHGRVPASLNFDKPNPKIDFDKHGLRVPTELADWPAQSGPRQALVNSLGLGGTNACAVIEQAPARAQRRAADQPLDPSPRRPHVLCLSAKSAGALAAQAERMATALEAMPSASIPDACLTANVRRAWFERRIAVVGESGPELAVHLRAEVSRIGEQARVRKPHTVFLFPGQGSHYHGAARALHRASSTFRLAFDRCADVVQPRLGADIRKVLFEAEGEKRVHDTLYAQPILFAVEYAICQMWAEWNVVPHAVIGHSVGEVAAACVAGAVALSDALELIVVRAGLMAELREQGGMYSVLAGEAQVRSLLDAGDERVSVAGINAPESTVLAGDKAALQEVIARLQAKGISCQALPVSHGFHSSILDPMLDRFEAAVDKLPFQEPSIPLYSNLTGARLEGPLSGRYLRDHARQPVRFMQCVQAARDAGANLFLEVGPGTTLLGLGKLCLGADSARFLYTLRRDEEEEVSVAKAQAGLAAAGHRIAWSAMAGGGFAKVDLPYYAFQRKRYSLKADAGTGSRRASGRDGSVRPLLGMTMQTGLAERVFAPQYTLARETYLDDHRIYGLPVLPTAAALDAAHSGAEQVFPGQPVCVREFRYLDPLIVPDGEELLTRVVLSPPGEDGQIECRLLSAPTDEGERFGQHAVAKLGVRGEPGGPLDLEAVRARCQTLLEPEAYYAAIADMGLNYGPVFRAIEAIHLGSGEALTRVVLSETCVPQNHALHPALADAGLHIYAALADDFSQILASGKFERPTFLPTGVELFAVFGDRPRSAWVHTVRTKGGGAKGETMTVDVRYYDDGGAPVAELLGLSLRRMSAAMLHPRATTPERDWIYEVAVRPVTTEAAPVSKDELCAASWVVLCDAQGVGAALCDRLFAAGAQVQALYPSTFCSTGTAAPPRGRVVDTDSERGLHTALRQVLGDSPPGDVRVVSLWALDAELPAEEAEPTCPSQHLCATALQVMKTIAEFRDATDHHTRLWLVTQYAQGASPEETRIHPLQAALWGMGRTFGWEAPQSWGGLIDVGAAPERAETLDAVLREIVTPSYGNQTIVRGAARFVPHLIRSEYREPDEGAATLFRRDGTYLITGGLGSLGLRVAKWMASAGAGHLVLTGRNAGDKHKPQVAMLEALGAQVTLIKADVSDEVQMGAAFATIDGLPSPLRGILHCAGVLDDGVVAQMEWAKFRKVTDPKIAGAWLLHRLSQGRPLEHFVLFSSILSLTGSAGQVNYAAGNAFLDALGEYRRRRHLPVQVLNWGPWDDGGLATASGDVGRAVWKSRGIEYIPPRSGMQVAEFLMRIQKPAAAIMIADWPRYMQQFASPPEFYAELAGDGQAQGGDRAARRKELEARRAKATTRDEHRFALLEFVAAEVVDVLGLDGPLDLEQLTADLGLDSLMAVNLVNRLEALLGRSVKMASVVKGPSVLQLLSELYPELEGPSEPASAALPVQEPLASHARSAGVDDLSRWLVKLTSNPAAKTSLLCFPFAGGGSAAFRPWTQWIAPSVELIAVEPPGRLRRIQEKPIDTIARWVDLVSTAIRQRADRPIALFGHCLGGLTMFETARCLLAEGPAPTRIFISGARPPHLVQALTSFEEQLMSDLADLSDFNPDRPLYEQADRVFAEALRYFGIAETEELLTDAELRTIMLPAIRAEFQMSSQYDPPYDDPRFDVPITCFSGARDSYVSREQMLQWSRYTTSSFRLNVRSGAHFLMAEDPEYIVGTINREIEEG
jgi:acyl transferase domain-containing protein/surfactin synthase thioesterase subunit/acyl carrier protein